MSMQVIERIEVGSGGAASITFTSIPQTYTDLLVVLSGRTSATGSNNVTNISLNGVTTNFSNRYLQGFGNSVNSSSNFQTYFALQTDNDETANTFSNSQIYIPNYTSSANKSLSGDAVIENNATGTVMHIIAGEWANTSAITSFGLTPISGNFVQYSSATLYGITAGSDGTTAVS